jgi:hypothetical protein
MNRAKSRWNATLVLVGLASLLGCQGFSTKSSQSPAPGQLALAPSTITFGNVPIGTRQTQSGSLTNAGGSSITVKQVTVNGTGYSISGLAAPLTLAVGQSASFSVLFAPSSAGGSNANISFATDASAAALTLSGMGVAPGDLTTSPTSIGFGNVQLGSPLSQTETLKNTGAGDLTVTAATVSGTGFSYTGLTLPLTLTQNQASTFGVSFTPATAGASSGSLSLTVSGLTSSVDIALSGTGVAPATLTALPSSLTFTNVQVGQGATQTETVTNTGGANAQISEVAASGTGFSISGIATPVTLTPGQSTSFSVTFTPHSAGNSSGSVSVTSNASNPSLNVSLTGSAVAATQGTLAVTNPISVGNVVDGLSGTRTATLTATGGDVLVSSISLGGTNPAEFSERGARLSASATCSGDMAGRMFFTRLDLLEHWKRHLFCQQVPHVRGNRGRLGARKLSVFAAVNIFICICIVSDPRKMLSHAECAEGSPASAAAMSAASGLLSPFEPEGTACEWPWSNKATRCGSKRPACQKCGTDNS